MRGVLKGTIKRWLDGRGYGFIEPEEGDKDIFVHYSEIKDTSVIEEGQKVEFEVQTTEKGPRAVNVKIIK